jgi:diaminopimelate epimerase
MCGNAALCCARIAVDLELVPPGEFCLLTDAGVVRVRSQAQGDQAEIELPECSLPTAVPGFAAGPGEEWLALGTVGVPHVVIRVADVETVDVLGRGREVRWDGRVGPAGANVNFISPPPKAGDPWLIRTFERGVEGETLACGTGTVAGALALAARGDASFPVTFRSRGGPELRVRASLNGSSASQVWLAGQGRFLFRGVWEAR